MNYQVIARKFRPQAFEEVVGQNPIVQTLKNAIQMDRIGHAYLFCGPRGVGKTTTARLLAKALNCTNGPTPTPCNDCPSCNEISAGGSMDVLEIDAASNTGVDSIRELRENARYAPSRDRFKIFIVDEVHMLSTSAFNALLKILEEPPPHIAFIMATTERGKLPATILSRCQQFVFRTIPPLEIQEHLRKIAEREGVTIGEGALNYVVKAAEGSMRDAQSLMDQIIAFGGQEIGDRDVGEVLGFIPADMLDQSVNALIERDSRALVEIVALVVDQGLNLQQFVREFLARVRDLLLAKLGSEDKILGSPEERSTITTQAAAFSEQDLIRFFDLLQRLDLDLKWTSEPRFFLEIGCIKLAKIGQLRDIEDVIRDMKSGPAPSAASHTPQPAPVKSATSQTPRPAPVQSAASHTPQPAPVQSATSQTPRPAPVQTNVKSEAKAPTRQKTESVPSPDPRTTPAPKPKPPAVASPSRAAARKTAEAPQSVRDSATGEPLVQRFLDVFRGDIAHVKSADKADDAPGSGNKPEEPSK